MNYIIKSNKITLVNGYAIDFEYPIKDVCQIEDVFIILTDSSFEKAYEQNVFAITVTGDFLWRIGRVTLNYNGPSCPYVGIIINKYGELVLFNWCDTAIVVNPLTGEVTRTYQTK